MFTKRHFLGVGLLAALLAAVPALLAHDNRVVLDDHNWVLTQVNDLDSTLSVLTDGDTHPPIYQVNVLRPSAIYLERPVPDTVLTKNPLTLKFRARAETNRKIWATLLEDQVKSWGQEIELTSEWKEYQLTLPLKQPQAGPARLALKVGGRSGEVDITDIKVVHGS